MTNNEVIADILGVSAGEYESYDSWKKTELLYKCPNQKAIDYIKTQRISSVKWRYILQNTNPDAIQFFRDNIDYDALQTTGFVSGNYMSKLSIPMKTQGMNSYNMNQYSRNFILFSDLASSENIHVFNIFKEILYFPNIYKTVCLCYNQITISELWGNSLDEAVDVLYALMLEETDKIMLLDVSTEDGIMVFGPYKSYRLQDKYFWQGLSKNKNTRITQILCRNIELIRNRFDEHIFTDAYGFQTTLKLINQRVKEYLDK